GNAKTTGIAGITKSLINERRQAQRESEIDKPTGLGNKDAFGRALPEAEKDPNSSIITLDLNGLKAANDQHPNGHNAGDAFIKEAADLLKTETDRGFRTGGDELTAIAPKEKAAEVIKNIEDKFGVKTFEGKDGKTYQVSITGT